MLALLVATGVVTAAAQETAPVSPPTAGEDRTPAPTDAALRTFRGAAEVVASRVADAAGSIGRREVVLDRAEIQALPVQSLQELLAVIPGVGLARRGARGVQGDLNLRGGSFEQALVLVNGVRVNNPQTGHHHLDLFIPLAAIERVEVLYGGGSAAHGPDAFGGAINIVTGVPAASAHLRFGEHDLSAGGVAGGLERGPWVALERELHSGFRDNTEADLNQLAGGWSWRTGTHRLDLALAAGRRRFGAHNFYSAAFPDQREATSGQLLTLSGSTPVGAATAKFALRLDHHSDDFILDRNRPEWYRNRHQTSGGLLDLSLAGATRAVDWVVGGEWSRDDIDSSNLGRHHRLRSALFAELGRFRGPLGWGLQLRADHQEPWGWVTAVAAGGSWQPKPDWRLRAHAGESYRAPSFTDLYYSSPATVGDPNLAPEEGRSLELGADWRAWSLSLFERRADPIIDYLLGDDGVWRATELGAVRTRGAELALWLPGRGRLQWQRVGLTLLDSELDVDPERSRYALAHPRAEAAYTGAVRLGEVWRTGWALRWREPAAGGSWCTVDLELGRRLGRGLWLAVEASNLLDREVFEVEGVPLPGRWLSVSLSYREEEP